MRVIAYNTETRKMVGEQTLRCDDSFAGGCQRPYVVSDGVVFIAGKKLIAWNPVTDTVTKVGGQVMQARNHVIQEGEAPGTPLDPTRVGAGWVVADELAGDAEGNLSFDGGWLLDNSGGDSRVRNWRDPRQVILYGLPRDADEAVFDTDGSVLVVTHTDSRWTGWDCTLRTGCRVVVPTQDQEVRLVGWDT